MTVEIKITGGDAEDAVGKLLGLAGLISGRVNIPVSVAEADPKRETPRAEPQGASDNTSEEDVEQVSDAPEFRAYGASDADKARRTKAQMAEDAEIEELAEALGVKDQIPTDRPASVVLEKLREAKAEAAVNAAGGATANISTGEERVDPEQTEPSDELPPATREDVRNALAAYAEKFGMPAAQKNGPALLGAGKISEIDEDPAAFQAAIDRIHEAING